VAIAATVKEQSAATFTVLETINNVSSASLSLTQNVQQTADGDFILHPKQKNSVTNNVITFTRKITIASESIAAAAAAVPVFPSPLILLGGIKRRYQNAQSTEQSGWW
jgi:hypothetical protein